MKILLYMGYQKGEVDIRAVGGLGGSESMLLEVGYGLVGRGHEVEVVGGVVSCDHRGVVARGVGDIVGSSYDIVIAINYIHYIELLDELSVSYGQSIFWMHNEYHFDWYKGSSLVGSESYYRDDRMSLVVCVSEWQRDLLVGKYDIGDKVRVISNGIDAQQFVEDVGGDVGNCDKVVMIYSSGCDRGLGLLLDMWPRVRAIWGDARLKLCSPSYCVDQLYQMLSDRGVRDGYDGIEVYGSLSKVDLHRQIVLSKYWVYPSRYDETFCMTALEMMYGRTVVISTDSGNLGVLLENNGYLTDHRLSDGEIIESMLSQIKLVQSLDDSVVHDDLQRVHERVVSKYGMPGVIDQWDKLVSGLKVDRPVDMIYVISLAGDDPLKVEQYKQRLLQAGIRGVVKVWCAVDGSKIDDHWMVDTGYRLYGGWKLADSDCGWWNRDMLPGEIGCAISHHQVWMDAYQSGYRSILVLEDDFCGTGEVLDQGVLDQVPINWDMLYLGRNPLTDEGVVADDIKVVVPGRSYNMHAYMLSQSGIKKLIDQQFEKNIMPVDEFIQCTHTKHARSDLHAIWDDSYVYAVKDDVLRQSNDGKSGELTSATEQIHLYGRLNKDLYRYIEDPKLWCDRYLVASVRDCNWDLIVDEPIDNVFCVPFFSERFCREIIEEAEHSGNWTFDRHEFYPTTDMLLHTLGLNDTYNAILLHFVEPLIKHVYKLDGHDWGNMVNENFLARYTDDTQTQLGIHHDYSDITALVNLSQHDVDYKGGGTYFPKYKQLYRPIRGSLSVHPGNITHKHGARCVTQGKRYIITSFMKRR